MARGLIGISCLMAAGGCVALNSGFEESGAGTGGAGSSDTGQRTTAQSDSDPSAGGGNSGSAVTTVTAGESSGSGTSDPTDSSGPSGGESGHPSGSSGADSGTTSPEESGGVDCVPATSATVEDDAFLRTCFKGVCSGRNYGQTEFGSLVDGEELGMLLLRIPNPGVSADQIEVSLHFFAEADLDGVALTLTAIPISPPCDWAEGGQDDDTLEKGEAGVTYLDCNGNPQAATPWSEEGNVWDHIDLTWSAGEFTFDKGEIIAGQGFSATMVVDRLVAGPTPDSLLIVSNTSASGELFVYTSEDDLEPPVVDVFSPCP